jgi:GH15 family glucan-1,4-alpha-glucosidase
MSRQSLIGTEKRVAVAISALRGASRLARLAGEHDLAQVYDAHADELSTHQLTLVRAVVQAGPRRDDRT